MSYDDEEDFESRLLTEYCYNCEVKRSCRWYPDNLCNAQCESSEQLMEEIHLDRED